MLPSIRPLAACLLCTLIAFGQLPALMHVACCNPSSALKAQSDRGAFDCSKRCRHCAAQGSSERESQPSDTNQRDDDREQPPHDEHDSDGCAVCRSLLLLSHLDDLEVVIQSEPYCLDFLLPHESMLDVCVLWNSAAPRGPPQVSVS